MNKDKTGDTAGVGLIVYTGSREELERKLRVRDDEITELRAFIGVLVENDPHEAVSDAGHTVLDLWIHEAREKIK